MVFWVSLCFMSTATNSPKNKPPPQARTLAFDANKARINKVNVIWQKFRYIPIRHYTCKEIISIYNKHPFTKLNILYKQTAEAMHIDIYASRFRTLSVVYWHIMISNSHQCLSYAYTFIILLPLKRYVDARMPCTLLKIVDDKWP